VAKSRVDEVLAALGEAGRDWIGARREILEQFSHDLLHRPALGGQIVARLCAINEPTPKDEDLLDLLGAGLDAARIARESGKARGRSFLDAVETALDLARCQGRMTPAHSLIFAQLWARNGLTAPATLELQSEDALSAPDMGNANRANGDAILDGLFAELISQSGGEPLVLHTALTESFGAMPLEMREHVVAYSVARADPIHADLACFWLLDPTSTLRFAAARAIAGRLVRGDLPGKIMATLVVLRSWMPADEARREVDQALKEGMRKGLVAEAEPAPWTIHGIRATLPDGGGAQSIGIALKSGTRCKMAMLLLKQGQGVKDAYTISCRSAKEQKSIIDRMADEVGARSVTVDYIRRALSVALADGLAQGRPPVPGLIEVARMSGLSGLRPEPKSTPDLIAELLSMHAVHALSPRELDGLILASEGWWDRHEIVESWFEESDEVHGLLAKARTARSAETALWKWLDTRRDWWARILARSADVLETALEPDAASFAACAMALLEGRDLKKTPVMLDVHEQTIEAWIRDDPEFELDASFEDLAEEAPEPEKKGEMTALLGSTDLAPDWLDGYLTGVVIAPKMLMPNEWLPAILDAVLPRIDPSRFQRFMDLIMLRAQAVSDLASKPEAFVASMAKRSKKAQMDWARGFADAITKFQSAWPKRGMTKEDRRLLIIASNGPAGFDVAELASLIALQQTKNTG
jgi:hypothetical protein